MYVFKYYSANDSIISVGFNISVPDGKNEYPEPILIDISVYKHQKKYREV